MRFRLAAALASFGLVVVGGAAAADPAPEARVDSRREAAVAAARAGRLESAIVELQALFAEAPDALPVRRDLGVVTAWAGRCAEAVALLAPVVEAPDPPEWVLEPHVGCLLDLGRLDEARSVVDAAMARAPDAPGVRVLGAHLLVERGELAAALDELDAILGDVPGHRQATVLRAEVLHRLGRHVAAFAAVRDLLAAGGDSEVDVGLGRRAARELLDAGAPDAAGRWAAAIPGALEGREGGELAARIEGDRAARRVRWGWAEPVFDPASRRHEAEAAIALLESRLLESPGEPRSFGDLVLAYRLADRMEDVVALWEQAGEPADAPFWVRNAVADAELALGRPAEAEVLYRSLLPERQSAPEPWKGIYWAAIEQRQFEEAEEALARWATLPGEAAGAEVQHAWWLLFQDRHREGQRAFERLLRSRPGDPAVREGLAAAYAWQGWPRRALLLLDDLLTRTTLRSPRVDRASARIARAGAWTALGDLASARREAADLVATYPENVHAVRLARDVDTALSPELRLDGRYDTSDRGLGEWWAQVEASVPLGTRTRLAGGVVASRSDDDALTAGDVEEAYLGVALRPDRWLALSGEVGWDVHDADGIDRDPAVRARFALFPSDRWRVDGGYAADGWKDLPLRARAAGIAADTWDLGVGYNGGARWNGRAGVGRSEMTDGNERTWGLAAADVLVRPGSFYHARFGLELYGSENTSENAIYFNPSSDRSASITHTSEWVPTNRPGRRHTISLLLHAGVYDQEGFDAGPVGGAWLQSSWDLAGKTAIVVGAGARSQLYDGSRELDPRVYVTFRRRF